MRWPSVSRAMLTVLSWGFVSACRGQTSAAPPIHLISDMQDQPKYLPEAPSPFFSDGSGMRLLPEGVVAQGELREDDGYYRGRGTDGEFLVRIPVPVDQALLARGEQRFDIFCTPCHDKAGSGHGIVPRRGFPPPVDLASDHTRGLRDGEIFDVMTTGVRNMPAYRFQVPVADRWAIVSWIRVLQRSQHGSVAELPPDLLPKIEPPENQP
jgi:hypothetical protein